MKTNVYQMKIIFFSILLVYLPISFCEESDGESPSANKNDIACINGECAPGANSNKANRGQQASNIAQKAAQEAKAAEDAQQQAGQQAAHQVKEQLAEKALEAAKAAEAALSGKEALVEQLQEEIKEAEMVTTTSMERGIWTFWIEAYCAIRNMASTVATNRRVGELKINETSLQQLQQTVQATSKAAQQSQAQVKLLQTSLQLAQGEAVSTQQIYKGAQQQLTQKKLLINTVKRRLNALTKQLEVAKADLAKTKEAAKKAETATTGASRKPLKVKDSSRSKLSK